MKTVERCIYHLKIGDVVCFENVTGKILNIHKGRGCFMSGSYFRIFTDSFLIGNFSAWGVHRCEGRRYPADKITILKK